MKQKEIKGRRGETKLAIGKLMEVGSKSVGAGGLLVC